MAVAAEAGSSVRGPASTFAPLVTSRHAAAGQRPGEDAWCSGALSVGGQVRGAEGGAHLLTALGRHGPGPAGPDAGTAEDPAPPGNRSNGHDTAAAAETASRNVVRATPVNSPAVVAPPEPTANPS